jgi:hypothetical protein
MLGQRALASTVAVAVMAFAVPTYAQTVAATEANSVGSYSAETTTKQQEPKMSPATKERSGASAEDESIRPFQVNIPDTALADLRRRIAATKWPERETVTDATQGVQLSTMRELARYWQTDYDWRKLEARLNALPQFMTEIDGLDVHFIHVRSKNPNALPVIITHGWPGRSSSS